MERLVPGPVYPDVAVITLADVVAISRMPCMIHRKLSYLKNVLEVSTSVDPDMMKTLQSQTDKQKLPHLLFHCYAVNNDPPSFHGHWSPCGLDQVPIWPTNLYLMLGPPYRVN